MRRSRLKPRSKKRIAKDRLLATVKRQLWARCNGHCEVPWCDRQANDAHHVEKRSAGGTDTLDNLVALCRPCHDATDYPSGDGRLTVVAYTRMQAPFGYGFNFFILGHYDFGDPHTWRIGPFTLGRHRWQRG